VRRLAPRASRLPTPGSRLTRDLDIAFYQRRIQRDSRSARDFTQLAALYLQRARETADNGDLVKAEAVARHSLGLRTARNGAALGVLASSLLAQHRFTDALGAAERLLAMDTASVSARGLLGEIQLELGRYLEAGRTLGSLSLYKEDLSVAPRLARWAELHGRPADARRLLRAARDRARASHGVPREQLAWFDLRLGDLALRNGHLSEAEHELRAGLAISPDDYRLLGMLSKLELVRRRWQQAIIYGDRAIAQALDPATLGVVGDAYAGLRDSTRAAEYYHAMEVAVSRQPGPFHRAWSLFLLDHRRDVSQVLAKAEQEIRARRDIYGYDLLAWALHAAGRDVEARRAMQIALALGTRDAMLYSHAGIIQRSLGDEAEAQRYLSLARDTNPHWRP
jgi:tetratricopeptide (TPR) repeat protein